MLACFTIIPIGAGEELKEEIAEILDIVDKSGLPYKLGAMQTTIEGDQQEVMELIMKCHNHLRSKTSRVLTSITIDDREGAVGRLNGKVSDVEDVLGRKLSGE